MVMKKERTGEKLIELFEKYLTEVHTTEQKLLLEYFKENVDDLPVDFDNPTNFHKAFRQIDVCRKGYQDMVIWSILSGGDSEELWKALEEFYA